MIVNYVKSTNMNRRRRDDLTCVICEGPASGHNFGQISCSSCKGTCIFIDLLNIIL